MVKFALTPAIKWGKNPMLYFKVNIAECKIKIKPLGYLTFKTV